MFKRLFILAATASALVILPAASAFATSPWWQVSTSSRPTNIWLPKSEVQEVVAPPGLLLLTVNGGATHVFNAPPFAPEATAANVQTALESDYGAGNVEVIGGPGGTAPLVITSIGADAGNYVSPIENAKILTEGGSGRVVLTITNVGDAPVDGSTTPVTIEDALPPGLTANHAEAFAGYQDRQGPVACSVESASSVSCSFEGTLSPYEAIEVEIPVSLTASPPPALEAGEVRVSGGNAPPASAEQRVKVSAAKTPFGIETYSAQVEEEGGSPATQAGSHPFQLTTTLQLNQGPLRPTSGNRHNFVEEQPAQPRNFRFKLPAGLVGDATAVPACSFKLFSVARQDSSNECPSESAVGAASVTVSEPSLFGLVRVAVPIFNLEPAAGEPARFGFTVVGVPVTLDASVRSGEAYGVTISVNNTSQIAQLFAATATFWGSPGDPRHDESRGWGCVYFSHLEGCSRPPGLPEGAFLRLPTACGAGLPFPMELEPWNTPLGSDVVDASFSSGPLDGCNRVPFEPAIEVGSDTHAPETVSGLTVHLKIPQEVSESPNGIAEADVRNTKVTLPAGLKINPAAANGLQACSEAQVGFSHMDGEEAVFDEEPAGCPEASKLGTVKVRSPLLEEELTGSVYQAAQGANPFDSLLALYVVADAPNAGVHVKLAGKVEPTASGQLISTFDATPQLPFEEFELSFFGGAGAPLATSGCGPYKSVTEIEPWSGGAAATPSTEFQVSDCPSPQPFAPSFSAGTEAPLAGNYSPFLLRLSREDGSQQLSAIDTTLPPGLTGKLAGIPYCPEAAIQQAEGRNKPGEGALEQSSPSCPAASQVGSVRVGSGVGPNPLSVNGSAYLAGPYKGAPLSLVIITPAVAGPFDLGTVVVRTALYVDPFTTQITAKSDPFPTMLQGIPLDVRSIALKMDRPSFVLNPTSCERMSVNGSATSTLGQGFGLTNPFQVGGCGGLGFKPKLKLSLKGSTKHAGHPALKAVLTYPKGGIYANVARAQVNLPHSEFLEQNNLNKTCTRPVLLEGKCPKTTIYGKAKAWTPLLDKPLVGNVYLVGGFGYKLPALVAELDGQIRVLLKGKVDSGPNKGIRNTFEAVPDAPVERFQLELKGGPKYSLLVNSEDLCKKPQRAIARFTAQSGKVLQTKPVIANDCGKHHKNKKGKKSTKK